MQDPSFWAKAIEQLPALALSLVGLYVILVKVMRFFNHMTTMFMKHQEERDTLFAKTIEGLGRDNREHSEQRQEALTRELRASREALTGFTSAQARHEQTMGRVANALERTAG